MRAALALALACACACGGRAALPRGDAPFLPIDSTVMGECVLGLFGMSPDGQCIARWVCMTDGQHTLSCGGLDGGVGCVCLIDGMTPVTISTMPASCEDPNVLTTFARTQCGWQGL